MSKVAVLLNTASGSCDGDCEATIVATLRAAGISPYRTVSAEGPKIGEELSRVVDDRPDVLIVLGGDGTIRASAEACGRGGITLLPLPGGTMNMLPRALYGDGTWQEILRKVLSDPIETTVSGGVVENHSFFCAGIFGAPALWTDAREAVRKWDFLKALFKAKRAYNNAFSSTLHYDFGNDVRGIATAVSAICPLISKTMTPSTNGLEAIVLDPENIPDAAHLAWTATFKDWRDDPVVEATVSSAVQLSSDEKLPAILDGERFTLAREARVTFQAEGFRALVPKGSQVVA